MSKGKYLCEHCDAKYSSKLLLQQHRPICAYIYSSRETEKSVKIPSQEVMFQHIVHLTKKYEKLEEKVKNIEKIANYKKRRNVNDYLKNAKPPKINYTEWVNQIEVSNYDLNILFENDLNTCIKSILEDMIYSDMPLLSLQERKNDIYIYDEKWHMITKEEFDRLIMIISHRALKKYVLWSNANKEYLEKNKDLSVIYMSKLNSNSEKLTAEMKKWLFAKICVSITDDETNQE